MRKASRTPNDRSNMLAAIITDSHFLLPFLVMVLGITLLVILR